MTDLEKHVNRPGRAKLVKEVFQLAREKAPAIIFIGRQFGGNVSIFVMKI